MGDGVTTVFSLADLRLLSEISADDAVNQEDFDTLCDAFPALVELACRAHSAVVDKSVATTYSGDELRKALARFAP